MKNKKQKPFISIINDLALHNMNAYAIVSMCLFLCARFNNSIYHVFGYAYALCI